MYVFLSEVAQRKGETERRERVTSFTIGSIEQASHRSNDSAMAMNGQPGQQPDQLPDQIPDLDEKIYNDYIEYNTKKLNESTEAEEVKTIRAGFNEKLQGKAKEAHTRNESIQSIQFFINAYESAPGMF